MTLLHARFLFMVSRHASMQLSFIHPLLF